MNRSTLHHHHQHRHSSLSLPGRRLSAVPRARRYARRRVGDLYELLDAVGLWKLLMIEGLSCTFNNGSEMMV